MTILPVYPHELLKFLSLSMMMFWIVFVFTLTRDTKDTLVIMRLRNALCISITAAIPKGLLRHVKGN